MNDNKNKKLVVLLTTITILFLTIAIYLVYFQLVKAQGLNTDPRNARNIIDDSSIPRGSIYDKNGNLLTYSEEIDGIYYRRNNYNYLYSNLIGYSLSDYGKSGLESYLNADLVNLTDNKDIFTKIDSLVDESKTNDVYLTIDDRIQSKLWDLMGDYKGAIIVTKPSTGAIVGMVSKPSFNVNALRENWDAVVASPDGLLLNRATQGLYEPGSIFKVVSSVAFLRSGIDLSYNDLGSAEVAGHSVENYQGRAYGQMDLEKALQVSANTYFYEKSTQVSNKIFTDTIHDFGIGNSYDFPLDRVRSQLPFRNGLSDIEKAVASFGQGETYITPLDMMLVTMAIANDGVVYQPYLVDKINRNGIDQITSPKVLSDSIEGDYARLIRSYLESTATYNGYYLSSGISLAGKTGTAETDEYNNLWYMGMAPADKPEYAIIVNIENNEGYVTQTAVPIATQALDYILNLN